MLKKILDRSPSSFGLSVYTKHYQLPPNATMCCLMALIGIQNQLAGQPALPAW